MYVLYTHTINKFTDSQSGAGRCFWHLRLLSELFPRSLLEKEQEEEEDSSSSKQVNEAHPVGIDDVDDDGQLASVWPLIEVDHTADLDQLSERLWRKNNEIL